MDRDQWDNGATAADDGDNNSDDGNDDNRDAIEETDCRDMLNGVLSPFMVSWLELVEMGTFRGLFTLDSATWDLRLW